MLYYRCDQVSSCTGTVASVLTFLISAAASFLWRSCRSVSLIDMRDEDEAALQPHSQLRHERMHYQYNRMREEENHWQDVSVSGDGKLLSRHVWIKFYTGNRFTLERFTWNEFHQSALHY